MEQSGLVPGKVTFAFGSSRPTGDAKAGIDGHDENPAIGGDALQKERGGNGEHKAHPPRQSDDSGGGK